VVLQAGPDQVVVLGVERHEDRLRCCGGLVDVEQVLLHRAWYLAWCGEALSGFLRFKGLSASVLGSEGLDFQIVRCEIDWRSGVRYGDDVAISVAPARIGTTSFEVAYEVLRDGETTCAARITYVSVHPDGSGKRPVPSLLRQALS
jgi:acyl-CoA thioester hydrolase